MKSIKRKLWTLTSGFLILALIVPAIAVTMAPAALAAPAITQVYPTTLGANAGQIGAGAPNVIAATAAADPGTTIRAMQFQTLFPAPFIGAEIFAQTPLAILPPRGGAGRNDTTPLPPGMTPASFPAGSVRLFVIIGVVTNVTAGGEWTISAGGQTFRVYESLGTVVRGTVNPTPGVGDSVRTVGMRSLLPGPLVADVITQRPAGVEESDLSLFLFTGTVETAGTADWTVRGPSPDGVAPGVLVDFTINDATFPAAIDPGIGVGTAITVEYLPTPALGGPVQNIGAEIFAQTPLDIPPTLGQQLAPPIAPAINSDPTPAPPGGLPPGSARLFVIIGQVTAMNPTTGEWTIAAAGRSFKVYQSAATAVRGTGAVLPGVGSFVRTVGMRALTPGPLVAEVITQRDSGDLADMSLLLFNGTVTATTASTWTVTSPSPDGVAPGTPVSFIINDPVFGAAIDPGIGLPPNNRVVTVEYLVSGLPPEPDPALWAPMTLDAASGQWRAVYNAPASAVNKAGLLFFRATDSAAPAQSTIVSSAVTLTAVPAAPPAAPAGLTATVISPVQVDLAWTSAAANEASFRLERATDSAFTLGLRTFILPMNSTSFSDTTVIGGNTYFYRLFAVNGAGDSAPAPVPPDVVSATPPFVVAASLPALAAPANGAVVANLTPELSWTASTGTEPITYELQVTTAVDARFARAVVNQTGIAATAFTVPAGALSAGISYRWRVRASNAIGPSTYTAPRSFRTPLGPTPPRTVRSGAVSLTPDRTWVAVPGATS
ncbi:MAG: hypothetical protein HYX90_05110 [Chloroflexi bacterium]|nr:hypothetical protein [Chloroflexota bacterium]